MATKDYEDFDFLSEMEDINVLGGISESIMSGDGIRLYLTCGWGDCRISCM